MCENQYDEIATPRAFKHATSGMIRGMLERSFVDVALFPCPTYGTGAI
ncbi:MAG: hypothetical protein KME31_35620 [Tolypothrix carrinoi HA7290-LM1]|jgi:hypothetical protein|nr:hypothetical protein [Tolypothrix carrinoi HA7290-LM1]